MGRDESRLRGDSSGDQWIPTASSEGDLDIDDGGADSSSKDRDMGRERQYAEREGAFGDAGGKRPSSAAGEERRRRWWKRRGWLE